MALSSVDLVSEQGYGNFRLFVAGRHFLCFRFSFQGGERQEEEHLFLSKTLLLFSSFVLWNF